MARHHDDDEVVVVEKHGSPVVPFLWGLAVGAVAALLLAPMSGEELRANLRERGKKLTDLAGRKMDELEDFATEGYEKARARVEAGLDTAKQRVQEGRQAAHDVVEAGRGAALTAREELEKRLADAREARRATRHPAKDEEPGA
jgi:gas vesicle protein